MSMSGARPVVVLSLGKEQRDQVRRFCGDLGERTIVDLRDKLVKDPVHSVGWQQDSTHKSTQKAVYAQVGFSDIVGELLQGTFANSYEVVAWRCHTGYHRGDTAAATFVEQLNAMVYDDGSRFFNAMHFKLQSAGGFRSVDAMLGDAAEWLKRPWCLCAGVGDRSSSVFFDGVKTNREAHAHFNAIWDFSTSLLQGAKDRAKELEAEGWRQLQEAVDDADSSDSPPLAKRPRSTPEWVTFRQDAKAWKTVLDSWGIDELAQQTLFLLAQHSHEGFKEANGIVAKLFQEVCTGKRLDNPSCFVHKCCWSARSKLA